MNVTVRNYQFRSLQWNLCSVKLFKRIYFWTYLAIQTCLSKTTDLISSFKNAIQSFALVLDYPTEKSQKFSLRVVESWCTRKSRICYQSWSDLPRYLGIFFFNLFNFSSKVSAVYFFVEEYYVCLKIIKFVSFNGIGVLIDQSVVKCYSIDISQYSISSSSKTTALNSEFFHQGLNWLWLFYTINRPLGWTISDFVP